MGGRQDLRLTPFLARDNPGLRHIREVYLTLEKVAIRDKDEDGYPEENPDDMFEVDLAGPHRQANFTVRLLLEFLPPNQLEVFKYCYSFFRYVVSYSLFLLVLQRRLKAPLALSGVVPFRSRQAQRLLDADYAVVGGIGNSSRWITSWFSARSSNASGDSISIRWTALSHPSL